MGDLREIVKKLESMSKEERLEYLAKDENILSQLKKEIEQRSANDEVEETVAVEGKDNEEVVDKEEKDVEIQEPVRDVGKTGKSDHIVDSDPASQDANTTDNNSTERGGSEREVKPDGQETEELTKTEKEVISPISESMTIEEVRANEKVKSVDDRQFELREGASAEGLPVMEESNNITHFVDSDPDHSDETDFPWRK